MSKWNGRSRGTVLGYKIFLFSIRGFGIKPAYFILRFVSFYFFLVARKNKNVLRKFYCDQLHIDKQKVSKLILKNFYVFGQTLIDRVAFLAGKENQYTHSFENEEILLAMEKAGKGGILLSAHVGNWETAGNLLKERVSKTIHVVMLQAEEANIKNYLDDKTGGSRFSIIPIKDDLSHVVKIKNALDKNELIAMHADRYMEGAKFIELPFFGRQARFPLGPFLIASKFNAPVSFVFAIRHPAMHYALSATVPLAHEKNAEQLAALYVEQLEKKVTENPEQWFNYYDFYAQ
jgi:predicted LPLAT superfamily acyltransferase